MKNVTYYQYMRKQKTFRIFFKFFWFKRRFIVEVACFLFVLLFVYAAVSKLLDYQKFSVQLGKSPILTKYSTMLAWIIPTIEIVISILLAIPRFRLVGLYSFFSLMIIFTGYIIAITQFSDNIPCSCGGVLQSLSWNQHLAFNVIFIIMATLGILLHENQNQPKPSH